MTTTTTKKKPAVKSRTKPVAKKPTATAAKTTAKAPAKKTAAKKAPAKKATTATEKAPAAKRVLGDHGYTVGTDSAIIADSLIQGGASREECNRRAIEKIEKTSGLLTRGGHKKYIPSMSATIIAKLVKDGAYRIEESFRLVPVEGYVPPAVADTDNDATVVEKPVTKKAPAKRAPAKKAAATKRKPRTKATTAAE